jgi:hypothetical protein
MAGPAGAWRLPYRHRRASGLQPRIAGADGRLGEGLGAGIIAIRVHDQGGFTRGAKTVVSPTPGARHTAALQRR